MGCKAEVKVTNYMMKGVNYLQAHEYNHKLLFVEFIDVGGAQKYENSRSIFYNNIDGTPIVLYIPLINSCFRTNIST